MVSRKGLFILLFICLATNLFAQRNRFELDNQKYKIKKQFDYFNYGLKVRGPSFEVSLSEAGILNVSMGLWSDWDKSHPEKVWGVIENGLQLVQDSLNDPLSQRVFTIVLTPDSERPLYRFESKVPVGTDFMEVDSEWVIVKSQMDTIIVVEYFNTIVDSRDSILVPIIYKLSTKDLAQFSLSEEWKQKFKLEDIARRKKFEWRNFRSRAVFLAGVGVGASYNGNSFLSLDGGVYYLITRPIMSGVYPMLGYNASYALAGFNGKTGLYLFHGLDLGAFSGNGMEQLSIQKFGMQFGAAHIKHYELDGTTDGYKSAAYFGLHVPLGKAVNLSLDFATNFRFTPNNHVGYFGGKVKFYMRFF